MNFTTVLFLMVCVIGTFINVVRYIDNNKNPITLILLAFVVIAVANSIVALLFSIRI